MSRYKFNQSFGRLQGSANGDGIVGAKKGGKVTYIPPYKTNSPIPGLSGGGSDIKALQEHFKITGHGDAFVYQRSARDIMMFRGLMAWSVVGIGLSLYWISSMARGTMKVKKRD